MSEAPPATDVHEAFTAWAEVRGAQINGVAAANLPGRGAGIVATRALKQEEVLVSVPARALLTVKSDVVRRFKFPADTTIHGQIAASLTLRHDEPKRHYKPWEAVWPKMEDFEESMPIAWSATLQALLPDAAKDLLKKQQEKLRRDKKVLSSRLSRDHEGLFTYYWLLVNTRCFYWDYPNAPGRRDPKRRKVLETDDCMALCPFADYLNHADQGCRVESSGKGFSVICDRDYEPGDEVYVSYGKHSNDFLLIEYGFVLDQNKWDETKLDHLISPKLSSSQRDLLSETGFLGNYTLDHEQVCYRTQVALGALVLSPGQVRRFMSGNEYPRTEREKVNQELKEILLSYRKQIDKAISTINAMADSTPCRTLRARWLQLRTLINSSMATSWRTGSGTDEP